MSSDDRSIVGPAVDVHQPLDIPLVGRFMLRPVTLNRWSFRMITFQVNDMTCGHCVATVTKAVKALDADARVEIDLPAHKVAVESTGGAAAIERAIRDAGYTPVVASV
jgi:copper chaperone